MKKHILKLCLAVLVQVFSCSIVFADDITINGTVTEETGAPLPGVTIMVKGTTIGTITDMDGRFTISVPEESTLIFSFLGFIAQEINVGNQSKIDVVLQENISNLNEVVVMGYGTQEARDVTGAVTSVKS